MIIPNDILSANEAIPHPPLSHPPCPLAWTLTYLSGSSHWNAPVLVVRYTAAKILLLDILIHILHRAHRRKTVILVDPSPPLDFQISAKALFRQTLWHSLSKPYELMHKSPQHTMYHIKFTTDWPGQGFFFFLNWLNSFSDEIFRWCPCEIWSQRPTSNNKYTQAQTISHIIYHSLTGLSMHVHYTLFDAHYHNISLLDRVCTTRVRWPQSVWKWRP